MEGEEGEASPSLPGCEDEGFFASAPVSVSVSGSGVVSTSRGDAATEDVARAAVAAAAAAFLASLCSC